MHYTGTIWRPPYEADSLLLEATAGCTHGKCKFCTLYDELPFKFRPAAQETIEADLLEAQMWLHDPLRKDEQRLFRLPSPKRCRVFLTGANPFGLRAKHLLGISELVKKYFPSCESIGCFARVTGVARKADDELAALADAGYDGLTIGVETGDDDALSFMCKGYAAADVVEQCARLDAAGIGYAFFYLVGVSGKGRGVVGAKKSAAVFNKANPWLVAANMLTVFPGSELYGEIERGNWAEESETEKYEEVIALVEGLAIPTEFAMLGASNPVMLQGNLPVQRQAILDALGRIISEIGEEELRRYRKTLRHL